MIIADLSNTDISNLVDEWIHNERNRKLLKRRLIDGICYDKLAEEFDLSVRQVKSIIYKSNDILLRHLK